VCAFRKGDPSAKLTVREAEGEIEFAVNQPKAWLAVSCGALPDKVSVYDMARAQLVSTIAIRTHQTTHTHTTHTTHTTRTTHTTHDRHIKAHFGLSHTFST
jgi:hypothetical protein